MVFRKESQNSLVSQTELVNLMEILEEKSRDLSILMCLRAR